MKVGDKSLIEWWVKDCLDIGYTDYRNNYVYDKEDVAMAVVMTLGIGFCALLLLALFLFLVVISKGILLVITATVAGIGYAAWKVIDGALGGDS